MCLSLTRPVPTFLISRFTFLGKMLTIFEVVTFPTLAEIIYFPGTSPTNLPSSKINPEAELLLSNDFPVNEKSTLMSSISSPFLLYAIASKFITSPDLDLSASDFKINFATGFFLIFKSIIPEIPSNVATTEELPSSRAKILFDLSI